jgi:molybdenum cofactor cytidylyltransferase
MNLSRALRFSPKPAQGALRHKLSPASGFKVVSFVGAGGKTTAIFQLAREIANRNLVTLAPYASAGVVTATTHLGSWQTPLADKHIIANRPGDIQLPAEGVVLVTGEIENDRTKPINESVLKWLREETKVRNIPLLIEADGSRQRPLKAPAAHEPPIPEFTDTVIVVAGLSALGKPLTDENVHRADLFSQLSGLQINQIITSDVITRMIADPQGGLKNIPPDARRIVFLNQADTPELQSIGGGMARELLSHFDSVIVGKLKGSEFQTFEGNAGIILAAGESTRFGAPKQLLDWKGKAFVRQVAETALQARLWPVVVVTGFHATDVESALNGLPVEIIRNPQYQEGQSTSIRTGILALTPPPPYSGTSPKSAQNNSQNREIPLGGFGGGRVGVGSAIFLLADQPQIPVDVIRALVESHGRNMQAILAPLVLEDRRANPVLFDRDTFHDLMQLTGDVGGRGIFDKHRVEYLPWHDDILLLDVDKPEDYQKLKEME